MLIPIFLSVLGFIFIIKGFYELGVRKGLKKSFFDYSEQHEKFLDSIYNSGFEDGREAERIIAMYHFKRILPRIKEDARDDGFQEAMKTLEDTWKQEEK